MNESNWELIAKHLAFETNSKEEIEIKHLLKSDSEFETEYLASKKLWSNIESTPHNYNRKLILELRDKKIKSHQGRKIRSFMKYAAILIGFAMGVLFIYHDLNSTLTIVADNANKVELDLPDGSSVVMKQGSKITYSNSLLLSFNREVTIEGQAFFSIYKSTQNNFIVHTRDYNIEVWGTKFNVSTNSNGSQVILTEGKVSLNNFIDPKIESRMLIPGQMAYFDKQGKNLEIKTVNTKIYTAWMENHIEFDNFSISELSEIFKLHYGKTLIINTNHDLDNTVGGSAPTDDINLIIKGLSIVLNREIIQQNDTIIIK
ncbi:MAG: FecR domain-containing protein [Bacteroidales bacterium]|nr:FecR domain-containing protein [Bacteroidales bacterium]